MLEVQDIIFKIKAKTLLDTLSFQAEPGQLIAILGPNGAGKSTLIKLLSREYKASTGAIRWRNNPLEHYSHPALARERAVLTQQTHMSYDFPVQEVVMMGRYPHFNNQPDSRDYEFTRRAMEDTEVTHLKDRSYLTLSGGEKQRVQMARVLAQVRGQGNKQSNTPKMLLLDEPLNNLDIRHQHSMMEVVKDFVRQGNAAVTVLHDLNLAALFADQLLLLHNGVKMAFGSPDQVLSKEILESCYHFPVEVQMHPFQKCPYVFFGRDNPKITALASDQSETPNRSSKIAKNLSQT